MAVARYKCRSWLCPRRPHEYEWEQSYFFGYSAHVKSAGASIFQHAPIKFDIPYEAALRSRRCVFMNMYSPFLFFTLSIKRWINVHDMLFMSLSAVKLILIRWFMWEAPFKCKELWVSHRRQAPSTHVRAHACVFERNNKSSRVLWTPRRLWALLPSRFSRFFADGVCAQVCVFGEAASHICKRFSKPTVDVFWTVSLKCLRLGPIVKKRQKRKKTQCRPGVGKHLLASRRLFCEGKEDLEVAWKDKKTCTETFSPDAAGNLPEWGLRFSFHLCGERTAGRMDVHLADNYNPLKANKGAVFLLQQEMSQIRRWCQLLLHHDWLPDDTGLRLCTTAWGLAGRRSEQGSHQSCGRCQLCAG